jgi:type I restriction-modification system DNA methylase subunit
MSIALNKPRLDNLAGDIWKSAERLRGKFKAYEYQNVILPIIVIRRLECVLIKWREEKAAEVIAERSGVARSVAWQGHAGDGRNDVSRQAGPGDRRKGA